jgi:hypothetical protein
MLHRPAGSRLELSDRAPPPRQRTPLVAVERLGANEHALIKRLRGQQIAARLSDAHHVDLRRRNGACHPQAFDACIGSRDGARQSRNLPGAPGSRAAGRLRPWRNALRAERALPSGVVGPRLARPLRRLASRLASLIMRSLNSIPAQ